jgi:hypothetical protein
VIFLSKKWSNADSCDGWFGGSREWWDRKQERRASSTPIRREFVIQRVGN